MKLSVTCVASLLLGSALAFFTAVDAHAETRRIAVLVGSNAGTEERPPLRYAESDAGKLARVLTELGGVDPSDAFLVQGRDLAAVRGALAAATARVAERLKNPADRVVLFFYFSGHSDGVAIEQGRERLTFADVRAWLRSTGAHVRLSVIDACKSGAFLETKGGTVGPSFDIRLADDLATSGEALLASSAANEVALESAEIGGSFFTHHFVSGLRGAADTSGDGRVTLSEAYAYAYARTLRTTADTLAGTQHAAYDVRLAGRGELVLTELSGRPAQVEIDAGVERALIVNLVRDQVIAEVGAGAGRRVAVAPGHYMVRAWRGGEVGTASFKIAAGEARALAWASFAPATAGRGQAKGDSMFVADPTMTPSDAPAAARPEGSRAPSMRYALFTGVGMQQGASRASGVSPALHAGVRSAEPTGPTLAVAFATSAAKDVTETLALGLAGYRLGARRGVFEIATGLDIGGGVVVQRLDGQSGATGVVAAGPVAGAAYVVGRWTLGVSGRLLGLGFRRNGENALVASPGAWLEASFRP